MSADIKEMKIRVYDLSIVAQQVQQEIAFLNVEISKLMQPLTDVNIKLIEMAQEQAEIKKEEPALS